MADRAPPNVRAVIVDDEPAGRDAVRTLLAEHPAIEIVGEASNGKEAVRLLRRTRPDLVFLDVQMPDLDGFGVLDELGDDVPPGVVFVTAHDEYAFRAFDVHAFDYLLKPFGKPRFNAAVEVALQRLHTMGTRSLRPTVASMIADRSADSAGPGELAFDAADSTTEQNRATLPRRIGVRTGAKTVVVDVAAIDWVEAAGDYARIHAANRTHVVSQRMHVLERLLESRAFVRVHRSLIVNVSRIRELHREPDGGGVLVLTSGVRLRVARGRWDAMERALEMEAF